MLKSTLSSLPLYHFTLLYALASIHHKFEEIFRHFLWQGGKNEKKKYNLVKWRQVTQDYENGGLGIHTPNLLNNAFGGNIVWRLISGQQTWWKRVIESKYLISPRQQLLDHDIPKRPCSRIWVLCKKAIPFLIRNLSKVPQGGRNNNIGKYRIMGQTPLSERSGTHQILSHIQNLELNFLNQISKWEEKTNN